MLPRLLAPALLALALGACMFEPSQRDYILAKTAEMDCQWLRAFALEPICHPYVAPEPLPPEPEPVCFKTLGDYECYAPNMSAAPSG